MNPLWCRFVIESAGPMSPRNVSLCTKGLVLEGMLQMPYATMFATIAVFMSLVFPAVAAPTDPLLIVPGHRIGKLVLGSNGAAVLKRFGKPDIVDAGMSQTRQVWLTKGSAQPTLFLHTVSNSVINAKPVQGVTIDEIRATSQAFHTSSGISTGTMLAQIRRSFPNARLDKGDATAVIYSDPRKGIAFEFSHDAPTARCIGITVFLPKRGHPVSSKVVSNLLRANRSAPGR